MGCNKTLFAVSTAILFQLCQIRYFNTLCHFRLSYNQFTILDQCYINASKQIFHQLKHGLQNVLILCHMKAILQATLKSRKGLYSEKCFAFHSYVVDTTSINVM